ncbi:D-alanine--D-alanine ligase [Candidatus Aerophobetes bacterium]|uniref:D-alanine--D-alanine ligase n=1 Tax=Aerophobetes bacterium TaxID=2030807 RepID=A0A497E4I2_UNCAE|nr:MAG: D-alanine--D-alanine ligase [Candidatus Aerophobetes bacterium]
MKEKICVLKGGISPEREISLKSGEAVERGLREAGYKTFSLDSRDRNFFDQLVEERPDVVFIALHGTYGEDGTIQGWLELAGITYTGSGVLASALAMDKANSRRILISEGILFPRFRVVERGREDGISLKFPLPWVVKPVRGGSTLGVSLVKEEGKLREALKEAFRYDGSCAIIEEYIRGREITVGIIDDPEPKVLPIIEILSKNELYDYKAKYTDGFCEFVVPASLKKNEYLKVEEMALRVYRALGCRDFARIDMIVKDGEPYLLEVNTIPGMTEKSLLPRAAQAKGISFASLVEKIVKAALRRKEERKNKMKR